MDSVETAVRSLHRQLDSIHRELDVRSIIVERDREDINRLRYRIGLLDKRVKALEGNQKLIKAIEVLSPFILIGIAIWLRIPIDKFLAAMK